MGANLPTATPVRMGDDGRSSKRAALGNAIASSGQAIGNYLSKREQQTNQRLQTQLQSENMRLQNMYLQSQIVGQSINNRDAGISKPGAPGGPSLIPGQGQTMYGSYLNPQTGVRTTDFNPNDPEGYSVHIPGEAPHQTMEELIGGAGAEIHSASRWLKQPKRRRKWSRRGIKTWRNRYDQVKETTAYGLPLPGRRGTWIRPPRIYPRKGNR